MSEYFLDITGDVCPMTFVKARLLLERMEPGAVATIRLGSGEPLENVPRSLAELGHEVVDVAAEVEGEGHRLTVRKCG